MTWTARLKEGKELGQGSPCLTLIESGSPQALGNMEMEDFWEGERGAGASNGGLCALSPFACSHRICGWDRLCWNRMGEEAFGGPHLNDMGCLNYSQAKQQLRHPGKV